MTKVDLPYINVQRGRDGRVRHWYFRRHGRRWALPGEPMSSTFMEEYQRLLTETDKPAATPPPDRRSYASGSFGLLVNEYLASAEYREKKRSTKAEYRRVLEALQELHGSKPVNQLKRRHIRRMRDERADTPGAANTIVRMLKIVLNFAVEEEWIESNPASKMRLLKTGEWRAWTDEECAAFEARWPQGSMQRRAYALAKYTGQRKSDLVLMTRADRNGGLLCVKQTKTDAEVHIPEHRELRAELARGNSEHMSLLTTSQGKAFDATYFGAWFAEAIEEARLPEDCVLHGLRKTAARMLAEAGCSEEEIKAVTGHSTSAMVSHYTRAADKKKQATAAILKLENSK